MQLPLYKSIIYFYRLYFYKPCSIINTKIIRTNDRSARSFFMRFKWYGTATLLFESGKTRLLIDPYDPPLCTYCADIERRSMLFRRHTHYASARRSFQRYRHIFPRKTPRIRIRNRYSACSKKRIKLHLHAIDRSGRCFIRRKFFDTRLSCKSL